MENISKDQLTKLLGFDVYEIESKSIASGGLHSQIYACKSEIGDLILRICKGKQGFYTHYFPDKVDWQKWMDQNWAISRAKEVGVPAPEIIFSDRVLRWTVMKRLPGIAIDSRYEAWQRCPYDEKEFGIILKRLHSIRPSGYGPIDDEGKALFDAWQEFLVGAASSAIETCLSRNAIPAMLYNGLRDHWIPKLEKAKLQQPTLLHMESLGFANILYDPESHMITGLLDYEDCIGGDPLFEILWMKYYFEHDDKNQTRYDFDRFAIGYGKIEFDFSKILLYHPFPYLDKLRWIKPNGARALLYIEKLEETLRKL